MMSKSVDHAKHSPARSAFTLIELLVVMGIIAILATLAIATMAPILENSRVAATKAIILHVDQQLQRRLSAFNELKDLKQDKGESVLENAVRKKHRYVQEFPQRLMDLYGLTVTGGNIDWGASIAPTGITSREKLVSDSPLLDVILARYIKEDGTKFTFTSPAERWQALKDLDDESSRISSSELIYILLTEGRALGTESYSLDGIPAKYITDEDGNGLMEIRDAWGNELRFYNAPTALFRPNVATGDEKINLTQGARILFAGIPGDDGKTNPQSGELYYDPFDKLGRTSRADPTFQRLYYPNTFFSYLIVSAGPDGAYGLEKPEGVGSGRLAQPTVRDELFDNITNRQQ